MTIGETAQACKNPDRTAVFTPRITHPSGTRTPVDQILAPALIEEIEAIIHTVPAINAKLVKELDERFEIEGRFGVSRRRLRNYVKRLHDKSTPGPDSLLKKGTGSEPMADHAAEKRTSRGACTLFQQAPTGDMQSNGRDRSDGRIDNVPPGDESKPAEDDKLRAHRLRQASIASILDSTFGPLAECDPELWDRRAYLMLVGMVYDRLACAEDELPAKELVALAKGLAEARRAEERARDHDRSSESRDSAAQPTGPLPENFADIVRQVYGTNFHAPDGIQNGE
ncbi:MAG: hypothetical protein ACYTFA_13335 [Planctomycetota bacterium]